MSARMRRPGSVLATREFFSAFGPWSHASADQRRAWLHAVRVAQETAQATRDKILAHRDLTDRVMATLGLDTPDQWTGFIPPRTTDMADGVPNRSEVRKVLVEILGEAVRREAGAA